MWATCGVLRGRALGVARSPGARAYGGGGGVAYTQGQSPEPRTREYFYYVDHQGQILRPPARDRPACLEALAGASAMYRRKQVRSPPRRRWPIALET
ncbi:UPF0598 protein C8orf82 homolog [Hippopotamus amphibius kiboko]|uniref:UPF0598 protein C8orf82 homolog n=1 Tax=Hippopotamus amphibius kiboko TaxID=575201 RepID=UPI0025928CAE|nr:UPF0598 protein C8orf82 homolog [Hippopotamus amphibius kiboko]